MFGYIVILLTALLLAPSVVLGQPGPTPIECPAGEQYSETAEACPFSTCNTRYDSPCLGYGPGCECPIGMIRDDSVSRKCITIEACPTVPTPIECPVGEQYSETASLCPLTCNTRFTTITCPFFDTGCECPSGMVREDSVDGKFRQYSVFGRCIPIESCPVSSCTDIVCDSDSIRPQCVELSGGAQCIPYWDDNNIDCPSGSDVGVGINGFPECFPSIPPARFTEFSWFSSIMANFDSSGGNRLKICGKRQDEQPRNGDGCAKRPKTCFFRTQLCGAEKTPTPMTECYCDGEGGNQTWQCKKVTCPLG